MTDQPPVYTSKQTPTPATYTRAAVAGGSTMALPFAFQQVIGLIGGIIHDIWPAIREPSDAQSLAIGILLTGGITFWASFSIRGTKVGE